MLSDHKSCPSHCCERHGCKYGYEDCPVVMKQTEQEGPCEFCPSLHDIQEFLNYYQEELKFWELLNARRTKALIAEKRKEQNAR